MRNSFVAFSRSIACVGLIAGCATPSIPKDQLKNYALLVPQDLYGNGAAVTEIDGTSRGVAQQMTLEGANILPGVMTRPGVNVPPGRHTVQVYVCRTGSTQNCAPDTYVFDALPGMAYVLRGPHQNIDILERFQKTTQGYLHPVAQHAFVTDSELETSRRQELAAAANAGIFVIEQRKRDQVFIRKVGARVCQQSGRDIVYTGYVESVAEDKVQIRVVDAQIKGNPSLHPSGFAPSIIWDSPMQWDLCR